MKEFYNKLTSNFRNAISNIGEKFFPKLKHHFALAHNGKEDLVIVLWVWGGGAYLISFFIDKFILIINLMAIKWVLSILIITYFMWHILAVRRCTPKKIPLTKEQKEALKKDRVNRFFRKLFLKEPITRWNPSLVVTVIDIYVISCFAGYLIR